MHKSPVEAFAPVFRLRGDTSPLFSSLSVRVATATTAGEGGGCPQVYFLSCPVLNSVALVVQTAGGVGVCVCWPI